MPLLLAAATAPAADIQRLFAIASSADEAGAIPVNLTLLNSTSVPVPYEAKPSVHATLDLNGTTAGVTLARSATLASVTVPTSGFVKIRYSFRPPAGAARTPMAVLIVPGWTADGVAFRFDRAAPEQSLAQSDLSTTRALPVGQPFVLLAPVTVTADHGNLFLANLSAYAPISAVFGSSTDTDGRLRLSFKHQLFDRSLAEGGDHIRVDGIHFGYTQRMYKDLGSQSSLFRTIDSMPELFYLAPAPQLTDPLALAGQAGFRHKSNVRDGPASRSLNTVYIQPVATPQVGGAWTLTLGPRVGLYAGSLSDNSDIYRYRGHTGLIANIGDANRLRVRTTSRFTFGTGKGTIDANVSYPLNRLIAHNVTLYLSRQGFAGYGENLLDYGRRATRLRLGIGIVC